MADKKIRIVFSTGAGVSAESGISTFRDSDGLWENHNVWDVASADGFARNPALIHSFYNGLRHKLVHAQPNEAHRIIAELENDFDVQVITQNVDDLHERAGSHNVLHLHGELMKLRSIRYPERIYDLPEGVLDSNVDTVSADGDPLRPHIVFFQEDVPNFAPATDIVKTADILVIIGTSMQVYPAAALAQYIRRGTPIYYIDPNPAEASYTDPRITVIKDIASSGMRRLREILIKDYLN